MAQASVPVTARAQVPGIINYQGRIVDNGTNFTGSGSFQFALVNNGGTTNYWSNDNTPIGEPSASVSVTVTKGLYSVLLGNAPMTAISPAVFTNSTVLLRVWFNDGVNGIQQLSPDQQIAAVGYALVAATVAGGGNVSANDLYLPATTDSSNGVLYVGGLPFLQSYGAANTFLGTRAGNFTMSGQFNTADGYHALQNNTNADDNTATGAEALQSNQSGFDNTADGVNALQSNRSGIQNTAVGSYALGANTGSNNIALGFLAGEMLTTGSNNIDIGSPGVAGEGNTIRIGSNGVQTATYIAGIARNQRHRLSGVHHAVRATRHRLRRRRRQCFGE